LPKWHFWGKLTHESTHFYGILFSELRMLHGWLGVRLKAETSYFATKIFWSTFGQQMLSQFDTNDLFENAKITILQKFEFLILAEGLT